MKYPTITLEQVKRIKASGRLVHFMPRKGLVRLDGYQIFRLAEHPRGWEAAETSPDAAYVSEGLGENIDFCPSDNL